MSKIVIETITPVHIGTGNILKRGFDFVERDGKIGIVEPRKVLQVLSSRYRSEEKSAIAWAGALNNNTSTDRLVGAGAPIEDYCSRMLKLKESSATSNNAGRRNTVNELKEFMRNGFGVPYMPGSSIKGAIRTAVFAHRIKEKFKSGEKDIKLGEELLNSIISIQKDDRNRLNVKFFTNELEKNCLVIWEKVYSGLSMLEMLILMVVLVPLFACQA